MEAFPWGGVNIMTVGGSFFGTNQSANTSIPSQVRTDYRNHWGVIFANDAMGVLESETFSSSIEDVPHRFSWLTYGRTIFGFGTLQAAGLVSFVNKA